MSEWYEPKGDDISIDRRRQEVDVYVKNNDFGNVHITLSFGQIRDLARRIDKQETSHE